MYALEFPKDHGAHPNFRIEWWYFTAVLQDTDAITYGAQWTLFRMARRPSGLKDDQLWMGNAALASPSGHYFDERLARGDMGLADVNAEPFEAKIDEWLVAEQQSNDLTIHAQGADFAFDLRFTTNMAPVLHAENGFSVKSGSGTASHYYSQPNYMVTGQLETPNGVVEVSGNGWMDHEWSSRPFEPDQVGWDWISLHMNDGGKLMAFRLRDRIDGDFLAGTWMPKNGEAQSLTANELSLSALATSVIDGREIPTVFQLVVPQHGIDATIEAIYPDSWMATSVPYWEGPVRFDGSHSGVGYLEMTGYE
ncbi:MAG: iron ABC transporter permease [Boseongicola sp.]|nr:MAG: iron ABC transporter permease [Boseongicola sp.]